MQNSHHQLGLWLIGAAGNVASTVAVGLAAQSRRRDGLVGLLTEQPPFRRLGLVPLSGLVLGGHEVSPRTVLETAQHLAARSGLFGESLLAKVAPDLRTFQRRIKTGTAANCGATIRRLATRSDAKRSASGRVVIDRLRRDMEHFARRNRLDRVVVINVASTEPRPHAARLPITWQRLNCTLKGRRHGLPDSSLYAIAAIEAGMPYVNFTPSVGANLPAIRELAQARGVPIMGSDAKTGETLLKSVLAPMFRDRCLKVLSWTGFNILGNRDGEVLATPSNKAAKLYAKDQALTTLLSERPQTHTSIERVQSLDDWKTAWDFIHFEGFLGTKMSLQFIWQGCDSILAAPLVIDLARLADDFARRGGTGVMTHLACFFKAPMEVQELAFSKQIDMLQAYAADAARRKGGR